MTTITAHPITADKIDALKAFLNALSISFEESTKKNTKYSKEFVAAIRQGEEDIANGNVKKYSIEELKVLCK